MIHSIRINFMRMASTVMKGSGKFRPDMLSE